MLSTMLEETPLPPDLPMTRLGDLLPHGAPASPWLYRLLLLRDDLDFELRSLAMDKDAEPIRAWENVYFLRRISVSIAELKSLWTRHVGRMVKRSKLDPKATAEFIRIGKVITETAKKLEIVRNALGGHVRLSNADPHRPRRRSRLGRWLMRACWWLPDWEEDHFERQMLERFAEWRGPALLDMETGRRTNFRGITMTAILVATGTDDISKMRAWHETLALPEACGDILHGIDAVIYLNARELTARK